ncbi:fibrous sheath-interacting protein 1 isoform X1 [Anguilla anguilla]|uniref:fibrous sheath-interacting protein 1 isoform X1 n=1 Tax=Anguilla anguilla TaxID=7936 RepID=UPI0015B17801|nr:fibrous sheath-interacting protein 1 isoform X1 [Anguilla anguilla]XP_035262309.1 fibrous sheath-interacting protein 1 isoform X1 [Anguilla anguilla]
MDITKGSLDSISRPASSERSRPGSRVSSASLLERRVNHAIPGSLVVLSPDIPEMQDRMSTPENVCSSKSSEDLPQGLLDVELTEATTAQAEDIVESALPDNASPDTESDEENKDPEVQKAIHKMRKLDKILALRISKEIDIKRQGKELHQKLWEELQELKPKEALERSDEAENTRLFLALSSSTFSSSDEVDYPPVFETQIPDDQCDRDGSYRRESETDRSKTADSSKVALEESVTDQSEGRPCGVDRGKKKQDFVKKNIELARDAGSQVLMTDAEKTRLAELLQDLDSGDEGDQADPNLLAVLTSTGEGYTPEPAELDQLRHIDSRLQLLLPVEDFLSLRSKYPGHSLPEGPRAGWDSEGDRLPGEKVLQDLRVTREQETRLREIEQQLEQDQVGTCGRPVLSEVQLSSLLEDCVVALSRLPSSLTASRAGSGDRSPGASLNCPSSPCSLLDSMPRLSDSVLSELLRSARSLETPLLGDGTPCG